MSDQDIFSLGTLNGDYPQRMKYGGSAYNSNGANTDATNSQQVPEIQSAVLWYAE